MGIFGGFKSGKKIPGIFSPLHRIGNTNKWMCGAVIPHCLVKVSQFYRREGGTSSVLKPARSDRDILLSSVFARIALPPGISACIDHPKGKYQQMGIFKSGNKSIINGADVELRRPKRLTGSLQPTPVARDILIIPESKIAIDVEINRFRLFPQSTRAFAGLSFNADTMGSH